ncbi:2-oxoacid ferredoxin oxidoreductase [Clostridium sp. D2Q-11]|uniref:2-oxoacid ferredoxin oxidoreductase n=1 Tax=Anaeromonas frigoriresistens TaxID=2683708 RepID=A0A942ZAV4_9FIRM|nr:thiamine pyrophosphate-dependent enzyme [Anaeromonas frigoriresistens]MBS4540140.1 2-oxoacid ferredoxin oxidoreductase [Anaeromonas frigoriresistens]
MNYNKEFDNNTEISWCPGCGNFGILNALKISFTELDLSPKDILVVSGIGQAAKTPHFINVNGFNGLHGRGLPSALGAKSVNKSLKVIVTSGDGDSYGEGGNHLIHNIRRNIDITHLVHNNQIYGLTKGQGSPTTAMGQSTTLQSDGMKVDPINPISTAIALGCSFVARSFSGDINHLKEMIKAGINHKGYALIDILQPCVTFNRINTFKWYKDRIYYLDSEYDPFNKLKAFEKSLEWDDNIPLGIIYKEEKIEFLDRFPHLKGKKSLVDKSLDPKEAEQFIEEFI